MPRMPALLRSRLTLGVVAAVAGALTALWLSGAGDWRDVALVLATGALTLITSEVSSQREAERQRSLRAEQRQHEREKDISDSRRRFHQDYINASRQTYLRMCDLAALMASGRGEEATKLGQTLALSEALGKADATLMTIDGDPAVMLAFSGMLADIAAHLHEPPNLERRVMVNDVASLIAAAFFGQEYRLANGDEPLRVTDRAVLPKLHTAVMTMRDALRQLAERTGRYETGPPPAE